MIPLGLNAEDMKLFTASLKQSHQISIRCYILDLDHNHVEDVTDQFKDGQVNVDGTQVPDRDLTCTLVTQDLMSFESGNISTGSSFATRLIQVFYGVRSELLDRWVWVPVFTGPISGFSRDGATVEITAQGKEALFQGVAWKSRTFAKGTLKSYILRDLLVRYGESRVDVPTINVKSDRAITLGPNVVLWDYLQSIARSWGSGRLIYDGRGRVKYFNYSSRVMWRFRQGEGGTLLGDPKITYQMPDEFYNCARVYGATPRKSTKRIFAEYVAPRTHPLSPVSMSRRGVPQYFARVETDDQITTQAAANAWVRNTVNNSLLGSVDVQAESLVIPHLEPWDVCSIQGDSYNSNFRLMKFSIPLNASGRMTIGHHARVSKWRRGKR